MVLVCYFHSGTIYYLMVTPCIVLIFYHGVAVIVNEDIKHANGKFFAVRLHKLRINFFILQPLIPQKGMSPPLKIANIIQHIMNTTANAILTPLIGTATITMQHIILITTTMNPTINFFIQHLNIVITSTTIQTIITF